MLFPVVRRIGKFWPWIFPIAFASIQGIAQGVGDTTTLGRLVTFFSAPLWVAAAMLLLLVSALKKCRALRLPTALSVVIILPLLGFRWGTPSPPPKEGIRVLTLNMQHGLVSVKGVAELIRSEAPDVLCLQEAGPLAYYPEHTPEPLKQALQGYEVHHSTFELIAVRGKIRNRKIIPLPNVADEKYGKVITAIEAEIRNREMRIATVHFAPRGSAKLGFFGAQAEIARVRKAQTNRLLAWVEEDLGPTIVCGDFNGHPYGRNYRAVTSKLTDAFAAAGRGLGYTLNAQFPHKRVDYIFCRGLQVAECQVLDQIVSDHRPVAALIY